jgi:hypothetical protein
MSSSAEVLQPRIRMMNKNLVVETHALILSLDTLPVEIITLTLHFLDVSDWFHFSLTSKRCCQHHKQARMPKTAVIDILQVQEVGESFFRKVVRWNTIFTEETGHLRIRNIANFGSGYAYDSKFTVDSIERMIAQEGFQLTGVSSLDISGATAD